MHHALSYNMTIVCLELDIPVDQDDRQNILYTSNPPRVYLHPIDRNQSIKSLYQLWK